MRCANTLILLLLAIFVVGVAAAHAQNAPPLPYVYRLKIADCTFAPTARRQTGFRVQGLVGIVTALHGLADCKTISAVADDGTTFTELTMSAVDIDRDLALLTAPELAELPPDGLVPSTLSTAEMITTTLRIVGYPLGLDQQDVDLIESVRDVESLDAVIPDEEEPANFIKRKSPAIDIEVLNIQAQLLPGHSGAPVLDGQDGVVAVGNGGLRGGEVGRSWAIPWQGVEWAAIDEPAVAKRLAELAAKDIAALAFSSTYPSAAEDETEFVTYTVRVFTPDNQPLANAEVLLTHSAGYEIGITDSEGFNIFQLPTNVSYTQSQIQVEASGYALYRRSASNVLNKVGIELLRLPTAPSTPTVVATGFCEFAFRVLDAKSEKPIAKAELSVSLGSQLTTGRSDSNGFYQSKLPCTDQRNASVVVRVVVEGFDPHSEIVTLVGDVKEILLAKATAPQPLPSPTSTIISSPTSEPTSEPASVVDSVQTLHINKVQRSSNISGVTVTVTDVEMLPQGSMRWHLLFSNQSGKDQTLSLYYPKVYLSDEAGNIYSVQDDKEGTQLDKSWNVAFQDKTNRAHWLEFSMPETEVQTFTVVLVALDGVNYVNFPTFLVTIPPSIVTLLPTSQPTSVAEKTQVFTINEMQRSSNINDTSVTVTKIDLLPNGRMRWYLLFSNQSGKDHTLSLHYSKVYLSDEFGNLYSVLDDKDGTQLDKSWKVAFQDKTNRSHWLEFAAPQEGAQTFAFVLVALDGVNYVNFPTFLITLPPAIATLLPTPHPTSVNEATQIFTFNETQKSSNVSGASVSVTKVELLTKGRMRWHLLFSNQSGKDHTLSLYYPKIYLSDEFGNLYSVLDDKVGTQPDKPWNVAFQDKTNRNHWLEFAAPQGGAHAFRVALVALDGVNYVNFPTFVITLQ